MDENLNENLLKFGKWYKITLIAGIFVLIANTLYTIFYFALWVKINNGSGGHYPIEIQLGLYITLIIYAIFRSIWLDYLTKMRKSTRRSSLTVFYLVQVIVVVSVGLLGIFGILNSIDEILYPSIIPNHILPYFLLEIYEETVEVSSYVIIIIEIIAWLFFYAYIKRRMKIDQPDSFKKIRTGIIVYVITLGIPVIWAWFVENFSLFQVFDSIGIVANSVIIFVIFSNHIIGLFFQFRIVNGILNEPEC